MTRRPGFGMTESYRVRRGRHRDGDETQNRLMRSLLTQTRSADSDGDDKGGDGRSQERGSIESECRPTPCSSASWCALGIPHGRARSRVVTIQGVSVCTHASTRLETMTRKRTSLTRLFLSVNLNSTLSHRWSSTVPLEKSRRRVHVCV